MSRSPSPFAIALMLAAPLLTTACADHAPPSAPPDGATASLSAARGSATGSGAVVVRATVPLGFYITDDDPAVTTIIGFTVDELRAFCAGGPQPEVVDALLVTPPTGALHLVFRGEDLSVLVWPFISEDFCGVLASTPPLATGTARWQGTDNAFNGLAPGANSFGIQALGTVTVTATGETLRYQALARTVISPAGEIRFPVAQVKLQ